ncbi:MAG TPA: GPW/gp25 family protein, partial [Saprospiraceae bacterium]|nr:GPW/gp25 family protein [Saprospiraceae bacterium]
PGVEMFEKEIDVASSLEILLSTAIGERVMLPEYGCNLEDLLFESLDNTTKTLIIDLIKTSIIYHEPRIDVLKTNINEDQEREGVLLIEIEYVIRSTNSRYNFVYPFYVHEGNNLNLNTPVNVLLPAI